MGGLVLADSLQREREKHNQQCGQSTGLHSNISSCKFVKNSHTEILTNPDRQFDPAAGRHNIRANVVLLQSRDRRVAASG
jgi:hypothetical protein